MYRGLTEASEPAEVELNTKTIGHVRRRAADESGWYHDRIVFRGNMLKNGSNVLIVRAADAKQGNGNDPFRMRCVICHFKQDA